MEALAETCGSGELRYFCLVNGALFVIMELIITMLESSAVNWDIMCTVSGQISVNNKNLFICQRGIMQGKSKNSTAPTTTPREREKNIKPHQLSFPGSSVGGALA